MTILHKLKVEGNRALLESAPPFVAGTCDTVRLETAFDQSWEGFSVDLLAEQMGADLRWKLSMDETGAAVLPLPLTQAAIPFFLWAEGQCDGRFLRTNSVCISPEKLCTGDGDEPPAQELLAVYPGPYCLQENGVYPIKDCYLAHDLTVDVPPVGVDTSMDTVTPGALLAGVTAHDASEALIVGEIPTYGETSANMNAVDGITLPVSGTYCAEDITVRPLLQTLEVAENGAFVPEEGYAGIGQVLVDVPPVGPDTSMDTVTPGTLLAGVTAHDATEAPIVGEIPTYGETSASMNAADGITLPVAGTYCAENITVRPVLQAVKAEENGTYAPSDGFAGIGSVEVSVSPRLQEKTAVANGSVAPDEGYDGLSHVTVQVPSKGIEAICFARGSEIEPDKGIASVTAALPTLTAITSAVGYLES